jgi:hypothetical protein
MMVFESIKQLLNGSAPMRDVHVALRDYEQFKRDFTMGAGLKGKTLGNAFCQHFKVVDYILASIRESDKADSYIRMTYIDQDRRAHEYYDLLD